LGEIGGEREINRTAAVERLSDEALRLEDDVLRCDDGPSADDRFGHLIEQFVSTVAKRVVHERAGFLRALIGHAHQVEHGQALGIGTGDAVDGAEFTDAVGCTDSANPANARIAVSGVGGIEFVAAADPANLFTEADGVVDGKRKIAGDAEDVSDTDLTQTGQNILSSPQ